MEFISQLSNDQLKQLHSLYKHEWWSSNRTIEETVIWQFVEAACQSLCHSYGYLEIKLPIVEKTKLFKRGIGDVTDIVEKEMYTFEDRNGDSLSLRPEATASCVRAGIEHGLLYNQIQRLWYMGPMFRHERPQKGRYRQFYQWGVEAFGMGAPSVEVELILMVNQLWRQLGIEGLVLQINTLGLAEERMEYRKALQDFLNQHKADLDDDSQRRIGSNPLRVFDSKVEKTQAILSDAPKLMDYLGEDSKQHFATVCRLLDEAGCAYEINSRLVRGLDYYNHTVFEWETDQLGAQATVCAGGRYDGLVEQLGGKATPAVGFSMGLERIVLLLQAMRSWEKPLDVYTIVDSDPICMPYAMKILTAIRSRFPELSVVVDHKGGGFKSQFKRANKSGARFALVFGEKECREGNFSIKPLLDDREQQLVNTDNIEKVVQEFILEK